MTPWRMTANTAAALFVGGCFTVAAVGGLALAVIKWIEEGEAVWTLELDGVDL